MNVVVRAAESGLIGTVDDDAEARVWVDGGLIAAAVVTSAFSAYELVMDSFCQLDCLSCLVVQDMRACLNEFYAVWAEAES